MEIALICYVFWAALNGVIAKGARSPLLFLLRVGPFFSAFGWSIANLTLRRWAPLFSLWSEFATRYAAHFAIRVSSIATHTHI